MSPPPSARLLVRGLLRQSVPIATIPRILAATPPPQPLVRAFSSTGSLPVDNSANKAVYEGYVKNLVQQSLHGGGAASTMRPGGEGYAPLSARAAVQQSSAITEPEEKPVDFSKPYKFSVYASKQNTHITVAKPNGDAIISLSCGNIGFRKSNRKKYDSAYQLAAFVIDQLYRDGWHEKINAIELTLRGFGQGREAVSKALCGYEGRYLKDKFISVADATRLKFGGTRARNPRRLG